jgi:type II secretory pathway pseudopilin PulG
MIKKKIQKNKGFTVMETLAAIFILLLSITGPMAFSQGGLRAAFVSRDQVSAFYLAQDAIEYIKNVRDNNMIDMINGETGSNWLDGLSDCLDGNSCTVGTEESGGRIEKCTGIDNPGCIDGDDYKPLKRNSPGNGYIGIYNSSKPDTIFARMITIDEIVDEKEASVTVKIQWNTHESIGKREVVVRENIYNWASF